MTHEQRYFKPTYLRAYVLRVNNTRHTPLLTLPLYLFFLFAFILSSFALHADGGLRLLTTSFKHPDLAKWAAENPTVIQENFTRQDFVKLEDGLDYTEIKQAADKLADEQGTLTFEFTEYTITGKLKDADNIFNNSVKKKIQNTLAYLGDYVFFKKNINKNFLTINFHYKEDVIYDNIKREYIEEGVKKALVDNFKLTQKMQISELFCLKELRELNSIYDVFLKDLEFKIKSKELSIYEKNKEINIDKPEYTIVDISQLISDLREIEDYCMTSLETKDKYNLVWFITQLRMVAYKGKFWNDVLIDLPASERYPYLLPLFEKKIGHDLQIMKDKNDNLIHFHHILAACNAAFYRHRVTSYNVKSYDNLETVTWEADMASTYAYMYYTYNFDAKTNSWLRYKEKDYDEDKAHDWAIEKWEDNINFSALYFKSPPKDLLGDIDGLCIAYIYNNQITNNSDKSLRLSDIIKDYYLGSGEFYKYRIYNVCKYHFKLGERLGSPTQDAYLFEKEKDFLTDERIHSAYNVIFYTLVQIDSKTGAFASLSNTTNPYAKEGTGKVLLQKLLLSLWKDY